MPAPRRRRTGTFSGIVPGHWYRRRMGALALSKVAPVLGKSVPVRGPARALYSSYTKAHPSLGKSVRQVTTKVGDRFEADMSNFLEWHLWAFGGYEEHLAELFRRLAAPGDTCIDVGANVGVHTVRLAKLVGGGGRVIAVEADPEMVPRVSQNVRLNGLENVRVVHAAASDHAGDTLLLHRPAETDPNQGRASLLPLPYLTGRTISLPTVTIDDLVSGPVSLVKIDVEGHERQVVMGAEGTIAEYRPSFVFEYAPELLADRGMSPCEWLSGRGYRLFDIGMQRHRVTGCGRLVLRPLAGLPETGTNVLAVSADMAARLERPPA
jgi:FkbM family methyltransferase